MNVAGSKLFSLSCSCPQKRLDGVVFGEEKNVTEKTSNKYSYLIDFVSKFIHFYVRAGVASINNIKIKILFLLILNLK